MIDTLEEVHLTENEGYLGRKIPSSKNHNISPQRPSWELSYLPADAAPPRPTPGPQLTSPARLAMPRRARSQASIMRMRGAVRSPSPEHPGSEVMRNQRPIPRRPESTGRLFEFVPMMKPKKSNTRCTNINDRETRSRSSDLSFPTQDLYVEPRPRTSLDGLPARSDSRNGFRNSRTNGSTSNGNGSVHNVNGFKSSTNKQLVNNRNGSNQFHNAWSESHMIRRSM